MLVAVTFQWLKVEFDAEPFQLHWKGSPACLRNCPQFLRCRLRGSGITESLLHRKVSRERA
jgi:hypothetical protein